MGVRLAPAREGVGGAAEVVGEHVARLGAPGKACGQVTIVGREEVLGQVSRQARGGADRLVTRRRNHEVAFALAA